MRWLAILLLAGACESGGTGGAKTTEAAGGSAAVMRGSAGGFSASLSADLAAESKGSAAAPPEMKGSAAPPETKGSAAAPETKGSAAVAVTSPRDAAVETPPSKGSAAVAMTPADAATTAAKPTPPDEITIDTKGPVKPPPELAAIKFELLPNWERDIGQAGTIVLDVKIHGGTERRTFTFHYGYDDPRAPSDRDAYKKFLGEQKLLAVDLDRQRGAAWYLEGNDAGGNRAFRYLVNYGGKHLICYGSLYKNAAGNELGDLRDEVIIQAKKICETLSL